MTTHFDWHILIVALVAYFIGWISGRAAGRRSAVGGGAQVYAAPPLPSSATLSTGRPIDQWPPQAAQQFEQHLQQGKLIDAIKVYREQTHVGLKDAKDAVEAIIASRSR